MHRLTYTASPFLKPQNSHGVFSSRGVISKKMSNLLYMVSVGGQLQSTPM